MVLANLQGPCGISGSTGTKSGMLKKQYKADRVGRFRVLGFSALNFLLAACRRLNCVSGCLWLLISVFQDFYVHKGTCSPELRGPPKKKHHKQQELLGALSWNCSIVGVGVFRVPCPPFWFWRRR